MVRALLEMWVLFKGGPYMRKYGMFHKERTPQDFIKVTLAAAHLMTQGAADLL